MGPFNRLAEKHPLDIIIAKSASWHEIGMADVVFIHRPTSPATVDVVRTALTLGKPVWVDYDDVVTEVPPHNPMRGDSTKESLTKDVTEILSQVSVVTVSTPPVKEMVNDMCKNTFIIPNAIDMDTYKNFTVLPRTDNKIRIMWRGSDSQVLNFEALCPIIRKTCANPNVEWYLHTSINPYRLKDLGDQVKHIPWCAIPETFSVIMQINPDIVVVSLFDSVFDQGRSPTIIFETFNTNTVVVAPSWWNLPGVETYKAGAIKGYSPEDIVNCSKDLDRALMRVISMTKSARTSQASLLKEFVTERLTLDMVNEHRWKLLQKLVEAPSPKVKLTPL
jgi:hypothetical protein